MACAAFVNADIGGLGAMGDSLSDEYAEESYDYAANWLEQLEMYGGVDVGPTAAEDRQPNGTWGEPRRRGFEFNWARSGADSNDLLQQGQHTGLARLVRSGDVTHAVLAIGQNDFAPVPFFGFAYFEIYNNRWSEQRIADYIDGRVANIAAALDVVVSSGAGVVLVSVIDFGAAPVTWRNPLFDDPDKRERVTTVIRRLNGRLTDLARDRRVVVADVFGLGQAIFGTNRQPHETLLLGNVAIELLEADTPDHGRPRAAFVHDLTHPHTTIQGVFANIMSAALNIAYDAELKLFSEREILAHAGLGYGGRDTLESEIGRYSDFVHSFALRPGDMNCDGSINLPDVGPFITALLDPGEYENQFPDCDINNADANEDGSIDLSDVESFINILLG